MKITKIKTQLAPQSISKIMVEASLLPQAKPAAPNAPNRPTRNVILNIFLSAISVTAVTACFLISLDQVLENGPESIRRRMEDVPAPSDDAAGDDGGGYSTIEVQTLLMLVFAFSFGVPIVRLIYYKYVSRAIESAREAAANARKRATERVSDAGRRVTSNRVSGRFK